MTGPDTPGTQAVTPASEPPAVGTVPGTVVGGGVQLPEAWSQQVRALQVNPGAQPPIGSQPQPRDPMGQTIPDPAGPGPVRPPLPPVAAIAPPVGAPLVEPPLPKVPLVEPPLPTLPTVVPPLPTCPLPAPPVEETPGAGI